MKEFPTFLSFPTANPHPISTATITSLPLISSLLSTVIRITTESHGYCPIALSLKPDRIKFTPQKDSWGLHSLAPTLVPNFISSCASSPAFRHTDPNILQTANPLGILEAPSQGIPLPLSSNSDHLNTSPVPPLERFCNNWWCVCVHHFTGTWASQEPRSCLSMSLSSPRLSPHLPHSRWSLSAYQMNTKETGTCTWENGTSRLGFLQPLFAVPWCPISRHPLCRAGHQHCRQTHPQSPGTWPHHTSEVLPSCQGLALTLESPRTPATAEPWTTVHQALVSAPKTDSGCGEEPCGAGQESDGIIHAKWLEQSLGPRRKPLYSFLPVLFSF